MGDLIPIENAPTLRHARVESREQPALQRDDAEVLEGEVKAPPPRFDAVSYAKRLKIIEPDDAEVLEGEVLEGAVSIGVIDPDTGAEVVRHHQDARVGMVSSGAFVEKRVRLTREEFAAVADGTYQLGETPENGAPVTTVVDKRGARNSYAAEAAARKKAYDDQRAAQAAWAKQAAGTMFWEAQRVGADDPDLATKILDKRAELVEGARAEGLPV